MLSHPQGNTFATSSTRRKQEKSEFDSSRSVLLKNFAMWLLFSSWGENGNPNELCIVDKQLGNFYVASSDLN